MTMKALNDYLYPIDVPITLARSNYGGVVADEERLGIGAHYDASSSDKGAINWFSDPAFKLSYHRAYTDNGRRIGLAPIDHRAYHMGVCRTTTKVKDANRAFYGLCVTAGDGQPYNEETHAVVTYAQFSAFVYDAAIIARYHQLKGHDWWRTDNVDIWLTGHNEWAVHPKVYAEGPKKGQPHPLAGKLGRKVDPPGSEVVKKGYEVLPINSVRVAVAILLDTKDHEIWKRFN